MDGEGDMDSVVHMDRGRVGDMDGSRGNGVLFEIGGGGRFRNYGVLYPLPTLVLALILASSDREKKRGRQKYRNLNITRIERAL